MALRAALLTGGALLLAGPVSGQEAEAPAADSLPRGAIPATPPQDWVTDDDYPPEALKARRQGRVSFVLTIDPQGKPSACGITESSGVIQLDVETCRLMMARARFAPALDAEGRPAASEWSSRFRWELPPLDFPLASWAFNGRFSVGAKGKVLSCSEESFGAAPPRRGTPWCEARRRGAREWAPLGGTAAKPLAIHVASTHIVDGVSPGGDPVVPPGFAPAVVVIQRFDVNVEGGIENCRMLVNGGEVSPSEMPCNNGNGYAPGIERHGVEMIYMVTTDGDPKPILDLILADGPI